MSSRIVIVLVTALGLFAGGCAERKQPVITIVDVPVLAPSTEPVLTEGADGHVYLSWVEEAGDEHVLRFSRWEESAWSEPQEVARGSDWFVNWADVPSLTALEDGTLAAAWLAKMEGGPYAYGVRVATSTDEGASWSPSVVPHRDAVATEHGFVSLVPLEGGRVGMTWLDGRDMGEPAEGEEMGPGSMTLRYTTLDRDGQLGKDVLLDGRVCDCCPTDAVRLSDGSVLVVYRDRSDSEVRDTGILRGEEGSWSEPALVHADGWRIAGCPVNGPRIAAREDLVAVAWFTAPPENEGGEVRAAFSGDGGRTFGDLVRVDDGRPLGRQDVVLLANGSAVVAWLEDGTEGNAEIRLREVSRSGRRGPAISVGVTASSRAAGFPRLARQGDDVLVAWTEVGEPSRVRSAVFR